MSKDDLYEDIVLTEVHEEHGDQKVAEMHERNGSKSFKLVPLYSLDNYGFDPENDEDPQTRALRNGWLSRSVRSLEQQDKRWKNQKLAELVKRNQKGKIKDLSRNGIPKSLRAEAWVILSRAADSMRENPGYYEKLLEQIQHTDIKAAADIEKDVDRTFVNHPLFRTETGFAMLRRGLLAFAYRNPNIGYCQSMNYLFNTLLLYYSLPQDGESAFWLFTTLLETILPNDYFGENMLGAHVDMRVLSRLVEKRLPKLFKHLASYNIDISLVALPWFVCMFVNTLPMETVIRVWDCVFAEGSKILFRVALALFQLHEQTILSMTDDSQIFAFLRSMGPKLFDADTLLKSAFAIRGLSREYIEKKRTKFRAELAQTMAQYKKAKAARSDAAAAAHHAAEPTNGDSLHPPRPSAASEAVLPSQRSSAADSAEPARIRASTSSSQGRVRKSTSYSVPEERENFRQSVSRYRIANIDALFGDDEDTEEKTTAPSPPAITITTASDTSSSSPTPQPVPLEQTGVNRSPRPRKDEKQIIRKSFSRQVISNIDALEMELSTPSNANSNNKSFNSSATNTNSGGHESLTLPATGLADPAIIASKTSSVIVNDEEALSRRGSLFAISFLPTNPPASAQ